LGRLYLFNAGARAHEVQLGLGCVLLRLCRSNVCVADVDLVFCRAYKELIQLSLSGLDSLVGCVETDTRLFLGRS
jgi:hypothetical protein